MKSGVTRVVIFYASGLGLTTLTYFIFGAGLGHGPGLYLAIPFLMYIIGIVWTVMALWIYFVEGGKTDKTKGIIYSNIVAVTILTSALLYSRSQNKLPDSGEFTAGSLNETQNGDTTSVSYNEALIYLKIKDSTYVDKRDSLLGSGE